MPIHNYTLLLIFFTFISLLKHHDLYFYLKSIDYLILCIIHLKRQYFCLEFRTICFAHIPWHLQILKINMLFLMYLCLCLLFLLLLFLLIPLIKSSLGYFYIPGHTVFHWNIADLPEIILLHKTHLPTLSAFHLLIRCEISCTTLASFGMWCCLTLHGDCAYCINGCVLLCAVSQLCLEDTFFLKFHLLPEPLHSFCLLFYYDLWNLKGGCDIHIPFQAQW